MIVRCYFACVTCRHPHTLRISVGANSFQKHRFGCRGCGEPIEVGLNVDYKTVSAEPVPISNCIVSDEEGSIVNLNPLLVVPDDLQGRDFAFPSVHEMARLAEEDPKLKEEMEREARPAHEVLAEWERLGRLPPGVAHDWEFAKRVWSLLLNGRHGVCSDYIRREHENYRFETPPHPYEVIFSFCARLGRRQAKAVYEALRAEWEAAGAMHPEPRHALRQYFLERHALDFLRATFGVVSEYMKSYSEFSQVLIYQDRGVGIGTDFSPSSMAFDDTKMFYGNAFECLASYLVLPACLNNVVEGRSYDAFKILTLDQYLNLPKAGRHVAFEDNPNLAKIAEALDNQIRNASHHGDIQIDSKSGYVIYRPTTSEAEKFIRYTEYLMLCNTIIQTIAALTCFVIAEFRPAAPPETS